MEKLSCTKINIDKLGKTQLILDFLKIFKKFKKFSNFSQFFKFFTIFQIFQIFLKQSTFQKFQICQQFM